MALQSSSIGRRQSVLQYKRSLARGPSAGGDERPAAQSSTVIATSLMARSMRSTWPLVTGACLGCAVVSVIGGVFEGMGPEAFVVGVASLMNDAAEVTVKLRN
jgi:hypothetical protein